MAEMDILIGKKIKKLRNLKGWSQEEIAHKLSISTRAYGNLENDKTTVDLQRVNQLAEAFGIGAIELLTLDENIVFEKCDRSGLFNTYEGDSSKIERDLYERQIKELKEEIVFLRGLVKEKK